MDIDGTGWIGWWKGVDFEAKRLYIWPLRGLGDMKRVEKDVVMCIINM